MKKEKITEKEVVDISTMGNILLGYNAKQLGLSLEETVLGAFAAQGGINSLEYLEIGFKDWRAVNGDLDELVDMLDSVLPSALLDAYINELADRISYEAGYNTTNTVPHILLQTLTSP